MAGIGDPNPRNQCWPEGPPFIFTNGPTQLVQQKDKVTILYVYAHQVRQVRMNQQHPAKVTPSWYGDSVGHYEGDTLVVDTVGIKVGRYSMVDWYGTPHTEALHVVERYRMLSYDEAKEGFARDAKQHNVPAGMPVANAAGKYLQLRFTVEDPNVFTTPWSATMTYRYDGNNPFDWLEQACGENLFWYAGGKGGFLICHFDHLEHGADQRSPGSSSTTAIICRRLVMKNRAVVTNVRLRSIFR
jgi:hypothetical protein